MNEPIPANMRTSFKVQKISGMNYTGADESFLSGGGIQLNVLNSVVKDVGILTGCGPAHGSRF